MRWLLNWLFEFRAHLRCYEYGKPFIEGRPVYCDTIMNRSNGGTCLRECEKHHLTWAVSQESNTKVLAYIKRQEELKEIKHD